MPVKVDVLEEDLRNGVRADSRSCALALALRRNGYIEPYVSVSSMDVQVTFRLTSKEYATSCWLDDGSAASRLNMWDMEEDIEPFSVQMPMNNRGYYV